MRSRVIEALRIVLSSASPREGPQRHLVTTRIATTILPDGARGQEPPPYRPRSGRRLETIRAQRWLGVDIVGAVAATGRARISILARRRRLDRPRDVPLRLPYRLGQVVPAREAGRDRGREHAAGDVQAPALAAARAHLPEDPARAEPIRRYPAHCHPRSPP